MRIISGIHKGRTLHPPRNLPVRPTTDFARTALFNMLQHRFDLESISVIDLFAGTGAISLELASRGCRDITAVDKHRGCIDFIRKTATEWKIQGLRTVKEDVFRFLQDCSYNVDLVFADPPYDLPELVELPARILHKKILRPEGLFILEHGDRQDFSAQPGFSEHRRYGNVNFSIFVPV